MTIVLDSWQKEVLDYKGSFVLCTGRQVGKTTIMAIKACEKMMSQSNCKIIIASLTEDQAKLIIVMMVDYLEKNYKNSIAKGKDKPTQNKIRLKNGSSAIARPVGTTGDALRGFTGDVLILDENSRMSEFIMTAAKPTLLTTGGELWICSTPFGKTGFFYECFQNKNNRFKVFHISSEEVIFNRPVNGNWTEKKKEEAIKFLDSEKKDMGEVAYSQEYLGLFMEELRRFFDDNLINECCKLKRPEGKINGKNYLGVDIARMGDDEGTLEIINELNEKYCQIENIVTKKQLTTKTENDIIITSERFNIRKIGIDAGAGSLGVSILDHLLETPLRHKVIALNNRSISIDSDGKKRQRIMKVDLYNNFKSMLEHGELLLLDEENVRVSLASVQYEFVKTPNKMTMMRIFGNYTHIVEGLIRACWIAKKEKSLNLWVC